MCTDSGFRRNWDTISDQIIVVWLKIIRNWIGCTFLIRIALIKVKDSVSVLFLSNYFSCSTHEHVYLIEIPVSCTRTYGARLCNSYSLTLISFTTDSPRTHIGIGRETERKQIKSSQIKPQTELVYPHVYLVVVACSFY